MVAITTLMISYRFVSPESPLFYIGMCAGFVSFTAFFGPVFSTVQDLSPPNLRGLTTAVLLLMSNLVGFGLGALLLGLLSDLFQSLGPVQPLTYSFLVVYAIGVFTVVAFFIGSIHWPRDQSAANQTL